MRSQSKRVVAIALCLITYSLARGPSITESEAASLASSFSFTRQELPQAASGLRAERPLDPRLAHLSGWISSVGASVAMGDLDGDGLPNDICLVDPRTDDIFVSPVPGTGNRYAEFTLTLDRQVQDAADLKVHPVAACPMGCRVADLNEDGFQDIVVYFWGRPPVAFIANGNHDQTSLSRRRFSATEIVPTAGEWYTNALLIVDVDGDGHLDIVVGNYDRDGTAKMDDDGDISSVMQHSMSRAYNGGKNRFLLWEPPPPESQELVRFKDIASGLAPDVLNGWTLALGAADLDDFDGDLKPEIVFVNDFGPDRLLHNRSVPGKLHFELVRGIKDFTTPNSKVLGRDSFKGMGIDFTDFNRDGYPDYFVSNIAGPWALEESHFAFVSTGKPSLMQSASPVAPYRDLSEELGLSRSGWGWDARFVDFNNDGSFELVQATGFLKGKTNRWPELHEAAMGNDELLSNPLNWSEFRGGGIDDLSGHEHNPFFVLASDKRYYDIARFMGGDFNEPYVTRGIAIADCDGDGDLDFAIANQWERSWYFRNNHSTKSADSNSRVSNPSLVLDLLVPVTSESVSKTTVYEGPKAAGLGSPAIGARVRIHGANGVPFASQVDGGSGHSGQRSPQIHFGLADKTAFPDTSKIEVDFRWRDRRGRACKAKRTLTTGHFTIVLVDESAEI